MVDEDLVSVVVVAHNEEAHIGACLGSVLAQDYPALHVIVVDGGSTDRTAAAVVAFASADPRVELVRCARIRIPAALNIGLARSRGRWLVRVDAHSTIRPGYVRTAVARLSMGCWAGVGGRKDGVGETAAGRAIAAAMSSRFGVGNSTYHYGTTVTEVDHLPFGAYPVALLREMGGWDESLAANEDYELDYRLRRAGGRLLFDPAMVIDWQCRQTVPELFRQYVRYGRAKADVARLHPSSLSPRHLAAPALCGYLTVAAVVGTRRPRLAGALVAPYPVAVAVAVALTARRLDRATDRAWLPAAFAAMHLGWGLGFWAGLADRDRAAEMRVARERNGGAS